MPRIWFALAACALYVVPGSSLQAQLPYDVVIKVGLCADDTGSQWYLADIGVRGGKIAKIGRIEAAAGQRTIDATGLVVAPGFIDMMGQTATPMLADPGSSINLLTQ